MAGRHRHPHVLADLGVHLEAGDVGGGEYQVVADGDQLSPAGDADGQRQIVHTRREMAFLVELPVVGQVGLRDDTQHPAVLDHHGAVVQAVAQRDRSPDGDQRPVVRGSPAQLNHRVQDSV